MSLEQKFKKDDLIVWDNRTWLIVNVDDKLYELKLVNQDGSLSKNHGFGGYMDISVIDATAKLYKIEKKTESYADSENLYEGGSIRRIQRQNKTKRESKISQKKRGSKLRRRVSKKN